MEDDEEVSGRSSSKTFDDDSPGQREEQALTPFLQIVWLFLWVWVRGASCSCCEKGRQGITKEAASDDDDDDDDSEPQGLQKQNAKMRWQGPGNALCLQVYVFYYLLNLRRMRHA